MIAVVIPCYKVSGSIISLIKKIGDDVSLIFVVDDCCPEESGKLVETTCNDTRVRVIYHLANKGVGGAVMTGYNAAAKAGAVVIVKIDGDGQMDPACISSFVAPILSGDADYTKGNRFYDLEKIHLMPKSRLIGNAILSIITKFSSGYWNLFDPTNGYTAIHANIVRKLPFKKISERYFFESDMLFRLNTLRAVVVDIPMDSKYDGENSNLNITSIVGEFLIKHTRNFAKRIFYNYYLRDMSIASIELPMGVILLFFGCIYGVHNWIFSIENHLITPAGTVMLSALPILLGFQLILAFLVMIFLIFQGLQYTNY